MYQIPTTIPTKTHLQTISNIFITSMSKIYIKKKKLLSIQQYSWVFLLFVLKKRRKKKYSTKLHSTRMCYNIISFLYKNTFFFYNIISFVYTFIYKQLLSYMKPSNHFIQNQNILIRLNLSYNQILRLNVGLEYKILTKNIGICGWRVG